MTESQRPNTNPQRGGSANQGQGTSEGLIGQATEAAHNVASGASDLAQSTYEQGSRYVRDGWDSLPDVDQYRGAVSRPVQENPLVGIMVAGALGYLVAYLVHGSGYFSDQGGRSPYARSGNHRRRR